jgi:hypothetical protein
VADGGHDEWRGNVRHIYEIAVLKDVAVATRPAYEDAVVEYRSEPDPAVGQEEDMPEEAPATSPEEQNDERRTETPVPPAGTLRVEERVAATPTRSLADEFRSRGFPGEVASIGWDEFRAVTWTGSVNDINQSRRTPAAALGADQRYAWPAVPQEGVDAGVTSVAVPTQTARSLAAAANVVRNIDAVTAKPETGSTLTIVETALRQVATIQTNVPNVYLESPVINTIVEQDLRLSINDGLDKLIIDAIAASGFQAPGTDPLIVSVRKAMTTITNTGYNPDTLLLTPAAAESLDLAVSGVSGGMQDFVFSPGQFAPNIWNLNRRISKGVAAPVVLDSRALGRLYASPVSLARFEAAAEPRTARTSGWSFTPCSALSARRRRSGSRRASDGREAESADVKEIARFSQGQQEEGRHAAGSVAAPAHPLGGARRARPAMTGFLEELDPTRRPKRSHKNGGSQSRSPVIAGELLDRGDPRGDRR